MTSLVICTNISFYVFPKALGGYIYLYRLYRFLRQHVNRSMIWLIRMASLPFQFCVFSACVAVTMCVSAFIARKRISCILQLDEKKERKKNAHHKKLTWPRPLCYTYICRASFTQTPEVWGTANPPPFCATMSVSKYQGKSECFLSAYAKDCQCEHFHNPSLMKRKSRKENPPMLVKNTHVQLCAWNKWNMGNNKSVFSVAQKKKRCENGISLTDPFVVNHLPTKSSLDTKLLM